MPVSSSSRRTCSRAIAAESSAAKEGEGDSGAQAADDAYASFFSWKAGAHAAHQEDEAEFRYAVGTGQALPAEWPKSDKDIARDAGRYTRPVVGGQAPADASSDSEFRESSMWSWRLFRRHLDNCVHYAECRLCEYVHRHT